MAAIDGSRDDEDDEDPDQQQHREEAEERAARALLVGRGLRQVLHRRLSLLASANDAALDIVKVLPLHLDEDCKVTENLVDVIHRLLNLPDPLFAFDDKRLAELDVLILVHEPDLLAPLALPLPVKKAR
eukprot:CAMPEP_0180145652 /NCGR_PEP_ID=MMETSP0986-20121125/17853_1 /TAXON_ID=697907 /ORGANISM="non described non described, Strain CCMP2293" /LENGTH=128 /DNA_ID=CAMNT_0022090181 /DNA_START=170 /DNA_END=554 /DNA_ORIENTATION=+